MKKTFDIDLFESANFRKISLINLCFQVTAKIKSKMMTEGTIMISYQPLGEFPNFFRSIISNQAVQEIDIDFMLETIDRLGHDL